MLCFVHQTRIAASPETVFAFHEREDILKLLFPPWQKGHAVSRSGGLEVGARVVFRLWLGPFPVTWIAVHTAFEKNRLFVDEQEKGPFAYWRHRHVFVPDGDGCILRDEIECSAPLGLDRWIGWWIERDLRRMFAYRHEVTARAVAVT